MVSITSVAEDDVTSSGRPVIICAGLHSIQHSSNNGTITSAKSFTFFSSVKMLDSLSVFADDELFKLMKGINFGSSTDCCNT